MRKHKGNTTGRMFAALALLGVGVALGYFLAAGFKNGSQKSSGVEQQAAEPEILYWVAPMDPNYRRDKPGKSPMGMDLVPVYAESGSVGSDTDAVRIDPEVEHNLGVRIEEAAIRPLWRRIEATGYVGLDEDSMNTIHMRTEGWVERLLVDAMGERVGKGQLLFEF